MISPRSVVGRVAWATAIAIAAGGVVVALVAGALADHVAREASELQVRNAAATLAFELREGAEDPAWIAADETRELAHTSLRIAIYEGERFVAGDAEVPAVPGGSCADAGALRACAVDAGPLVAIAAQGRAPLDEQREAFAAAATIAVLVTSLLGALAARTIARWSTAPLARLRDAVDRVPEDDPGSADLGPREGVAEVDALRASLATTLARLGHVLAQSRRFAADAAHELRTPLATVMGEIDLAIEGDPRSIENAKRTAARLAVLVDRLLILATPAGKLTSTEPVELADAIADACASLPPPSRERVTVTASAARVDGDHALLVAMVSNAIENALKFSDGPVRVTLEGNDERVRLRIDDEGPGIPAAERERVFAPFHRLAGSRAAGIAGHGIGLALIAHVVLLHGGTARFADKADRGARLEIELPASTHRPSREP